MHKSITAMRISIVPILRKDKVRKDNTAPVHIRVTQNRKSRFVGTGITIPTDSWDIENESSLILPIAKNFNYRLIRRFPN